MSDSFDAFWRAIGAKTQYDSEMIRKAFEFASDVHSGQHRKTGEDYIVHPIAVAEIVSTLGLDTASICAALLHDTVEDCAGVTRELVAQSTSEEIASLVDGLTNLTQIPFESKEDEHIENLRKIFLAMSKDIRVIFVKLADRLHNMRTLSAKPIAKQKITALETMQVYAPIAHRLGIQIIKQELENLSLLYLDREGYNRVLTYIDRKYGENTDFIRNTMQRVSEMLDEIGIRGDIEGRVKSVYSIYKKMYKSNKSFDEIYDFYAIRIIVDTEPECYTVLGHIHEIYNSMPGRFKDYISTPKPNMYQSLHTTVIGHDGVPFEVQIRTRQMHEVAEYGIAAHWKYKDGQYAANDFGEKLKWIRTLLENERDPNDPDEFFRPFKIDLFEDETFVFTPKGDVITLPSNSNCIDFAYAIHSAVGNKLVGAKINGNIAPLDTVLQTGQIVEAITSSSSRGPSRDWLTIVRSSEAKNKIRQWFKKEMRTENIAIGKSEIDREFRSYGVAHTEAQKADVLENLIKRLGTVKDVEDLYNAIGYGGLSFTKIEKHLREEFDKVVHPVTEKAEGITASDVQTKKFKQSKGKNIIVEGLDGCEIKLAHCCNPLPGDTVVGFVTRGRGVTIHKTDCPNVVSSKKSNENDSRWVNVWWTEESLTSVQNNFEAALSITARKNYTVLAKITNLLADMKVSISSINTREIENDEYIISLVVVCKNLDHLKNITARLGSVENVSGVRRSFS